MMHSVKRAVALAAIAFCVVATGNRSVGQEEKKKEGDTEKEFVEQYNERFIKRTPLLNTVIKDVAAWDEAGKPLNTQSLRGKHTVLVFGCLT